MYFLIAILFKLIGFTFDAELVIICSIEDNFGSPYFQMKIGR